MNIAGPVNHLLESATSNQPLSVNPSFNQPASQPIASIVNPTLLSIPQSILPSIDVQSLHQSFKHSSQYPPASHYPSIDVNSSPILPSCQSITPANPSLQSTSIPSAIQSNTLSMPSANVRSTLHSVNPFPQHNSFPSNRRQSSSSLSQSFPQLNVNQYFFNSRPVRHSQSANQRLNLFE
jgi:hypothetical protein